MSVKRTVEANAESLHMQTLKHLKLRPEIIKKIAPDRIKINVLITLKINPHVKYNHRATPQPVEPAGVVSLVPLDQIVSPVLLAHHV